VTDRVVCIVTEEWFETADLVDHMPDSEAIERYCCPVCGNHHNYRNGRPTLAPMMFECRHCGDEVGSVSPGGLEYCDDECRRAALDEAVELLSGR